MSHIQLQESSSGAGETQKKRKAEASAEDFVQFNGSDDGDGDGDEPKKGRRKIKIEYIADKSRRHITFSKRKAGIMKKAYELSTLTGTQVLLLVASETGHVYTFATPKLQPLITKPEGKNLIQGCLNVADDTGEDSPELASTGANQQSSGNGQSGLSAAEYAQLFKDAGISNAALSKAALSNAEQSNEDEHTQHPVFPQGLNSYPPYYLHQQIFQQPQQSFQQQHFGGMVGNGEEENVDV
ncbi:hypothetical protein HK098_003985 [Nowakowskiella sp. JEL0407]|nr:hypothetical protein HK098_003985 [Nowakowskiella sp. JEL0407]